MQGKLCNQCQNDVVENILPGKLCKQCQNEVMGKLITRKIM